MGNGSGGDWVRDGGEAAVSDGEGVDGGLGYRGWAGAVDCFIAVR